MNGRKEPVRAYKCSRDGPDGYLLEGDPNKVNPNEDYPFYKSLRQVCKRFEQIATPLLFETVILLSHAESWQNLDKIAKSPPLAEHMKTIQIATIHHLPHYSSFEAWYEQHEDLFNSNWQFTDSYPMGEPFSHMSRQPKAYFKRYQRWRSGEKTMINHWENGTAPTLQLNLLKRLYMVETIGHDQLDVIKREHNRKVSYDGHLVGSHRSYRNVTRRKVETLILDELRYGKDISSTHLETFLRAVDIYRAPLSLTYGFEVVRNLRGLARNLTPRNYNYIVYVVST